MPVLKNSERRLAGELLPRVSRSFYLSLRFLPSQVRGEISLAYLLARASDTMADTEALPAPDRLSMLQRYGNLIQRDDGDDPGFFHEVKSKIQSDLHHQGERALLQSLRDCLDWFGGLAGDEKTRIRTMLGYIVRGQSLDVERFGDTGVGFLSTASELDEYTFLVAGCVGEFWTEVCAAKMEPFASQAVGRMREWGKAYGKALQLINILRDIPEDWKFGRCYLPSEELFPHGDGPETIEIDQDRLLEVSRPWLRRCEEYLGSAIRYVHSLQSRRLKFATALPLLIGEETVALLQRADWAALERGVKVTRGEVRRQMLRGVLFGFAGVDLW